ncbi:hypothetical protein MXL54_08390 [Enterobacteriaceae bacterium G50]|nr:hypothetical protein [Enterobacteriaceae bacterium G50]
MKLNKEKENLILEQVKQAQASAEGDHNLQQARWNESYLYYTGELPKLSAEEKSAGITEAFTEPVLYNATCAALPQILDSFTEDDSLAVAFRSNGAFKNPALENLITGNMNKIVLHDQDGYQLLENMIRETLITGDSFGKVYIDETKITENVQVDDFLELSDFLTNIAENWFIDAPGFGIELKGDYKGFEWKTKQAHSVDQQGNPIIVPVIYVKGNVPLAKVDSKIAIEQVESKDLWADTSAGHDFNRCPFICHRIETTVGEAELRGYDKEKLKAASDNDKADELPTLYFSDAFAGIPGNLENNNSTDPKQKRIYLYENYIKSSLLNRKGETRSYQVITTGSEVLKVTEITRFPFVHGQCETVVGQFYGRSFYDICKQYQDAQSHAQRMIMLSAELSTYPQYLAIKNQYNRESLLNSNRPGAVIEVNAADGVSRFTPQQLPQQFYENIQLLKDSSAQVVQTSTFGSKDLVNGVPQIAAATVAMSLYQDGLKGAVLCKALERTLIKPLYSLIYEIVKDESYPLLDDRGQAVEGLTLPNLYEFVVDVNTSQDDFAQSMQLSNTAGFIAQLAQIQSPVLTPQNQYNIAKFMCERMDLDANQYFTDPSQNQDPHQQQMQARAEAINAELQSVQLETAKTSYYKQLAEIYKIEAETEELIRDGHNKRVIDQQESLTKMAKVQNDKDVKEGANAVRMADVNVKNKAVNYEAISAAANKMLDVTAPQVNINGIK